MLIGHISLAYFARARWARAELVMLLVATMLPDLGDLVLPQGEKCRANCGLLTHAFPAFLVLAAIAAAFAWIIWHRRAVVVLAALMVISHIGLDLLTGYKQFWIGGPATGFVLYQHAAIDFAVEAALMIGAWLTLRKTTAAPRHAIRVWVLVLLLCAQGAFDVYLHGQKVRQQQSAPRQAP